ncbi:MAG: DUF4830 domain-containing protein [Acutalibacteraceae bacterium]|nr:DUF4830 domain-containing protein [Acutalibacteraceae bacterium]
MPYFCFKIKSQITLVAFFCVTLVCIIAVDVISCAATDGSVSNNDERILFINNLGYEVERDSFTSKNIIIPTEFSDVFKNYNKIQQKAGYDLSKYKGNEVELFSYKSAVDARQKYNINLIVFENTVIGGDISSVAIDGKIYPLQSKESNENGTIR